MEYQSGKEVYNFTLLRKISGFGMAVELWLASLTGTDILFQISLEKKLIKSTRPVSKEILSIEDNQYIFIKEIGSGTYGNVYEVQDINTKKKYALKIFLVPIEGEDEAFQIKLLEGCPNIPKMYFSGYYQQVQFFTLMDKLVNGIENLELPINAIMSIIKDILTALEFIHSKELVHGDVKTANILLDELNIAYLCDFSNSYQKGCIIDEIGTIWYRAPEYCLPSQKKFSIDYPSDIWGLGICFLALINDGKMPKLFKCDNPHLLYTRISDQELINETIECVFSNLNDFYNYEFHIDLCKKFLTVEPTKRITATEALQMLKIE